jgi:ubiquitin
MKLQTKSTFGNFAIEAEAEVSAEQRDYLANLGLLQVLQRSPASAAEKALAGYDKRPSGFKRDSIPFNEANAEKLIAAMEAPIEFKENGEEVIPAIFCSVVATEYVPSVADVKMTDERNAYARHGKAGDLPAFAAKVGYDGQLGDGTKEGAPVDFLRAIKRFTDEWLRNQA